MTGQDKEKEVPMHLGFQFPSILLPSGEVDMTRWAVIACDQYTSDPEYWNRVEEFVGDSPSTLRLMLPEVYLCAEDADARLGAIAETTSHYLSKGLLEKHDSAPVLVVRETGSGRRRLGVLLSFDLEAYDFAEESTTVIRPTEETIVDRLPPRVKIRSSSPAEFPHILVLIDDPDRDVVQPLYDARERLARAYDTELMMGGGRVTGYLIEDSSLRQGLVDGIERCYRRAAERSADAPLLFAMGDGNHSMATAKKVWEQNKAAGAPPDHPSRYALAELVSMYDPGLVFEPIHRIIGGKEPDSLLDAVASACNGTIQRDSVEAGDVVRWITAIGEGVILPSGTERSDIAIQRAIESIAEGDVWVDYIHGESAVRNLVNSRNVLGILMPGIGKGDLFSTVEAQGALPRKMFSLGEADEKRYYVEGRMISDLEQG